VAGHPAELSARTFDVLMCLVDARQRVVTKDELLSAVWRGLVVEENNLTVHVARLRKVLGPDAIATVSGVGYRFTAPAGPASAATAASAAIDIVPSLAVLPFANLSGDAGQDYLVDGIVEDLTNALSRVRGFRVVARSSSFTFKGRIVDVPTVGRELGVRYVVEGSFRQADGRLRIGVQLAETHAGHRLWEGRFEGSRADVFALQDEIGAKVAAAIEPSLARAETECTRCKPTDSLVAYELCLQARPLIFAAGPRAHIEQALALLYRALAADSGYSYAKSLVAWASAAGWANGSIGWRRALQALPFAREAAVDHRDDPSTLAFAAIALGYLAHDHDAALHAVQRALALNPNSVNVLRTAGWVLSYVCQPDRAIEHLERAAQLNPLDPEHGYVSAGLAWAHLIAGRGGAALTAARAAQVELPGYLPGRYALLHALCAAGQPGAARAVADDLLVRLPGLSCTRYRRTLPYTDGSFVDRCVADLAALGLPP
jgi:TolB-like protein